MAIHAGEAATRNGDYFGPTLNRTARVMSAGHGGQVLLTAAAGAATARADHGDHGDHGKGGQRPEFLLMVSPLVR